MPNRTCERCHAPEGVRVFRAYSNRFKWTADIKEVNSNPDFCLTPRVTYLAEVKGALLCRTYQEVVR
jgi:hypothetical protein